jgi:plastocyanin
MNTKTLGIVILVVALAGAGYWYASNKEKNDMEDRTTTQTPVNTNENTGTQNTNNTGTGASGGVNVGVTVGTPKIRTFTVTGGNFKFDPATITVDKGDVVRIVFKNSQGTHDLKIDEFNVNTGIIGANQERTVEFTASQSGSFEYYCSVGSHRAMGMKGTLIVK